MIENVCNIFVLIVSILIIVELFRNLLIVRNNKCEKDEIKIYLRKARVLIVIIILIYIIYGIIRNIV